MTLEEMLSALEELHLLMRLMGPKDPELHFLLNAYIHLQDSIIKELLSNHERKAA